MGSTQRTTARRGATPRSETAAAKAGTDPNVGQGEQGMNAARREAQNAGTVADAKTNTVKGVDGVERQAFPETDQTAVEQNRQERGSQIRGTGDMQPPVHGATRHVETSSGTSVDFGDPKTDEKLAEMRAKGPSMRVRATKMGYYGDARRRTGDVFTITSPLDFSTKWMETVDGKTPERTTTGKEELRRFHDQTLADRHAGTRRPTGDQAVLD